MNAGPPLHTPLTETCRALGARLIDFSGWLLPVQFTSVLEEHHAVRAAAGLFDVSHMGQIEIRGRSALDVVQILTCNDAARLTPGRAQYSALTTERGTLVDDVIVYRHGTAEFLIVVNAANTAKDFEWIRARADSGAEVVDASARWALLALQGPRAAAILQELAPDAATGRLRPFDFATSTVAGVPATVARTGYTGEDGFEIFCRPEDAADLFQAILAGGRERGLRPCGLGARDTLRLEARLLLYGNDMDETTTVLEAGLDFIVRVDKGDFLGREVLRAQREAGPPRRLCGFEMKEPGIPRHGYRVTWEGGADGTVTSGGFGPTVKRNIGLVYLPAGKARPGTDIAVDIRGREAGAVVVPTPFYRRVRPGGAG